MGKTRIYSFQPFGYDGTLCEVECDLRRGIPSCDIVGITDSSVSLVRETLRASIKASDLQFPPERVLLAVTPCDLKKDGLSHTLALAVSVMLSDHEEPKAEDTRILVMGETGLDGKTRSVKGIVTALREAEKAGITRAILPKDCEEEVKKAGISGEGIFYCETVKEAAATANNTCLDEVDGEGIVLATDENETVFEDGLNLFDESNGHKLEKFALAVSSAGRFNAFFRGNGIEKLLTSSQEIEPSMNHGEWVEASRIHEIAGLGIIPQDTKPRPFRIPHPTTSIEGMCGGGAHCSPGEISLAHHGTLLMENATEFRSSVLQMLKVPLINGKITLSRAGRTTIYPANFRLLMQASPCPCGNFGSKDRICLCSAKSVEQFRIKTRSCENECEIEINSLSDEADPNRKALSEYDTTRKTLREEIKRATEKAGEREKYASEMKEEEINSEGYDNETARAVADLMENGEKSLVILRLKRLARCIADMRGHEEIKGEDTRLALAIINTDEDYI